ncbi:hypothetical protein FNV43_RR21506 [Rhamnella rubrinervis]|uniref:Uncharacterized protein n=1 Tax=Rhamnella rubrinervis TaxID=2594499 RepID=A0A8K0E8J9_9ROSA|nr:hypothetical protein FNV43_RR21506 [Rhamnella rubrinervis]
MNFLAHIQFVAIEFQNVFAFLELVFPNKFRFPALKFANILHVPNVLHYRALKFPNLKSTTAGKKSTGPTAVGSTSSVNEKNPTGFAAVGDVNENKEIDELVMAADESSIGDLRYQIGGLGDQVVRIGEKISGVVQASGQGQQAFQAAVDNTGRYIPPPAQLDHHDQYGHGRNGQGEIYVARLNDQNGRNDDAACQNDLSRMYQRERETAKSFLARFKRARNRCHLDVLEREFVKLAMSGLSYRRKKKFVGMEFGYLFELVTRATRYEDILNEEYQCKNSSKGTYYKDPNLDINLVESEDHVEDSTIEVGLAEVVATWPYMWRALVKPLGTQKTLQLAKETKTRVDGLERIFYFDITKADQIFDLLLANKVIKLPDSYKTSSVEEIKKRQYYKWHHSWSHDTVNCIQFRNTLQALIEKGILKFLEKGSEVKDVDNNPFLAVGVNMTTTNISKLAPKKDLSVSTDRSNKRCERSENEREEIKEKQLCTHCKHEIEAETRPEKDIKYNGKAILKSPPESYGPYSPKRNFKAKSVFSRLGSIINQVQLRLSLQVTISQDDQHRIVSLKAEKSSQQLLRGRYEDGDHEVGLLGAPSGKFEYYVQYLKPNSYHQYPIKPTGWDLDKPRQHDVCLAIRHMARHNWTTKTFRPPVTEKRMLQREHTAARREAKEIEKGITTMKQVEDGTVGPLAKTFRAKDDVTDVKQVEDRTIGPLAKTSRAMDDVKQVKDGTYDSMAKMSKAKDDDSLAKGRPDPLKNFKPTYKEEKRFKWVLKEKKNEPQSVEEVGDIIDEDIIENQPVKDEDLTVSVSEKELKAKLKFGSLDETECNTFVLPLVFEARPNQPSSMDGDVEEEEISKPGL